MAVEHSTLTGDSIAEKIQIIKDATADIKQAIIDKGGSISGDITTWADAIRGIKSEATKSFYVKSTHSNTDYLYLYEDGMTWEEWINSEYNYNHHNLSRDGMIHFSGDPMYGGNIILMGNYATVKATDYINENYTYAFYAGGSDN